MSRWLSLKDSYIYFNLYSKKIRKILRGLIIKVIFWVLYLHACVECANKYLLYYERDLWNLNKCAITHRLRIYEAQTKAFLREWVCFWLQIFHHHPRRTGSVIATFRLIPFHLTDSRIYCHAEGNQTQQWKIPCAPWPFIRTPIRQRVKAKYINRY